MLTVTRVAIITDSASDLQPAVAAAHGITVVPLQVSFGGDVFLANQSLTTDEFWNRMLAPNAPFPTTAAASPGEFAAAFQAAFDAGAESVVCITVSGDLSGTLKSVQIAAAGMPGRDVRIIDSRTVSAGQTMLAQHATRLAAEGRSGAEIAAAIEDRKQDVGLYVALDTLEYLKRGGRISGTRAAVGSMLSIKPIITVVGGIVENADRVRTRAKARERVLELLTEQPLDEATVLHTPGADADGFREEFIARSGLPAEKVQTMLVGPSVGPHIGPGCLGGVFVRKR
jgi:fatty acid kinase fatty acid binding subunit